MYCSKQGALLVWFMAGPLMSTHRVEAGMIWNGDGPGMGFILGCGVALGISQHQCSHIYLRQGHPRACYKKTAGAPRAND